MDVMHDKTKEWIDGASYEDLLRRWRFSALGDSMFQGVTGKYYSDVMFKKKAALTPGEQVAASKSVGWDNIKS